MSNVPAPVQCSKGENEQNGASALGHFPQFTTINRKAKCSFTYDVQTDVKQYLEPDHDQSTPLLSNHLFIS